MASLNTSHHSGGGVLLYQGELILLYCEAVQCEITNKDSVKGRIYLTTHRVVFTAQPLNQSRVLQSLAAPFSALFDMSLEQPVFGANYIKGKLRTDSSENTSATTQNVYQFKLKFSKGGAIEFGQALREASRRVPSFSPSTFAAPGYTASAFAPNQFYQAPDSVYQPNYPVGFALPTHVFSQAPPPGFVYTYQAPPPYPGLVTAASEQQQQPAGFVPGYNPNQVGMGSSVEYPAYPTAYPTAYAPPQSFPQAQNYPPPHSYPPSQGYPANSNYPPPTHGYPAQQAYSYPPQSAPTQQSNAPAYPSYPSTNEYSASGPSNGAPPGYTPMQEPEKKAK